MFENIDGESNGSFRECSKRLLKFYHTFKIPILFSLLQWLFTTLLQIDRFFADYSLESSHYSRAFLIGVIVLIKIIYLLSLFLIWCNLYFLYKNYKTYKREVSIFFTYAIISSILLFFLWPGTWSWDDLHVIKAVRQYKIDAWQHILTSIFQILCLQYLPFPAGIILIQNLIISVCVAFIVSKLERNFCIYISSRFWDLCLKLIPFLLPPVLMYQFSGYRMGLYVYLESVMLCVLLCSVKEKQDWSYIYLIFLSCLCAIVATWRAESFLYIPLACIIVITANNDTSRKVEFFRKKILAIFIIIFVFFTISFIQKFALRNSNYEIVSTIKPLVEVIRITDSKEDEQALSAINKVLDLKFINANPEKSALTLYWTGNAVRKNYSSRDYKEYINAFFTLSMKYYKVVLAERLEVFLIAIGVHERIKHATNIYGTLNLFKKPPNRTENQQAVYDSFNSAWILNKPLFPNLRNKLIQVLGMQDDNGKETVFYHFVWNASIPILFLSFLWFTTLFQRKWIEFLILTTINLKTLLIFLTEPASWFMYFLSQYFLGYLCLIYFLLYFYTRHFLLRPV